jgi:hypothetical protein
MTTRPLLLLIYLPAFAQNQPAPVWKFAVSGDSRNCGDVVMPAIASGVLKSGANFYWHLGDFRAISQVDEDMAPPRVSLADYLPKAWPDFIDRQLRPFGNLEILLGIGNHETTAPKTREAFVSQFETWLNSPRLRTQRERDKEMPGARSYYHWVMNGAVDFINLDNATGNAFDPAQMAWVRTRLSEDQASKLITTIVVGMHEALPGSNGFSHSMCDARAGIETGREVYNLLSNLQRSGKKVYLLASHSHFVMDNVYNTAYWQNKVLPGWIIGTAGAVRYRLPPGISTGTISRTDVYGYLLAGVMSDGTIRFEFKELSLADLRAANVGKAPDSLVGWCYAENKDQRLPKASACGVN